MVPSLRPVAAEVVHRAALAPGERVLDVGTGTGIGAQAAVGQGRTVIGIDAAEGMLEAARTSVAGASFERMDFHDLDFGDASFDCVIAVHALLFASDRVAALAEWRRVTRPGGRLSLSVPGPDEVTPSAIYAEIYARNGIHTGGRYPTQDALAALATDAGWRKVRVETDPAHQIRLPDEDAFRLWRSIGSRGAATADWSSERHDALTAEMLAVTPRAADGSLQIPFGAMYLSAGR